MTGHRLGNVHMHGIKRHRGDELEWDVDCQRYSHQNSPHSVSLLHFTLCHSYNAPPVLRKLHPFVAKILHTTTWNKIPQQQLLFPCFSNRRWSRSSIQSLWVQPASGASAEACSDRGDQKHCHPHMAVQPTRRRSRCHLLHYWSFQVCSDTHVNIWFENIYSDFLGCRYNETVHYKPKCL